MYGAICVFINGLYFFSVFKVCTMFSNISLLTANFRFARADKPACWLIMKIWLMVLRVMNASLFDVTLMLPLNSRDDGLLVTEQKPRNVELRKKKDFQNIRRKWLENNSRDPSKRWLSRHNVGLKNRLVHEKLKENQNSERKKQAPSLECCSRPDL